MSYPNDQFGFEQNHEQQDNFLPKGSPQQFNGNKAQANNEQDFNQSPFNQAVYELVQFNEHNGKLKNEYMKQNQQLYNEIEHRQGEEKY